MGAIDTDINKARQPFNQLLDPYLGMTKEFVKLKIELEQRYSEIADYQKQIRELWESNCCTDDHSSEMNIHGHCDYCGVVDFI